MFVLPSLASGGTERHVVSLARSLVGEFGAVVATVERGPLERELLDAGVQIACIGPGTVRNSRVWGRLLALVKRTRPSVVHAFLGGFDVVAAFAARVSGVPLVVGSRRELSWWMEPRHRLAQSVGTALCDVVVCCASAVRADAVAAEAWPADRYRVILNSVEAARFTTRERSVERSRLGLRDRDFVVATVANLAPEKGHADLARAARLLGPVEELRLLWAGDGPLRAELEAATTELRASGTVRFLGHIDDVAGVLAAADLFVFASRYEGLPNAVLEAMASGLAVVATEVGGVPEIIEHGVDGWLVRPGDVIALHLAIVRLMRDPELRRRLGDAARTRVVTAFGEPRCVGAHRDLYREEAT